ncbi:hypothetical protein [Paracidobacterium acidisoli]|uniref:Uncharacterized protein n=1 Tax=Paracidobacterium acidisoli TaxID=2303751 RepID=A0A372IQM1_9BACT|nr:hypothetical protein [Paracidobacterium acidisoli]MBT9331578.1 hypothetical protein [Paracidobacterium acidisoli]
MNISIDMRVTGGLRFVKTPLSLLALGVLTLGGCGTGPSGKLVVDPIQFTNIKGQPVSVSSPVTSLSVNQGAYVMVTLTGDTELLGADWSVICGSALPPGTPLPPGQTQDLSCGSFSPTHTASGPVPGYATSGAGYVAFYTAPAAPPKAGVVTLYASSTADPSRFSSITLPITGLPISVGFAPQPPASIALAGTVQLTAVVSNDYNAGGATWSVACQAGPGACGSFGPMQTESGAMTTYTAPAIVPAGGAVTITATSVADPTKYVSATITILPISVSISPVTLSVGTNETGALTAVVTNDGENRGVDWSVSCTNPVDPGKCGSVSPQHTASGASTTYTAPALANIAAGSTIAITATSSTDPTKSATATVTAVKGQLVSGIAQAAQHPLRGARVSLYAVTTSETVLNSTANADDASAVTSTTTDEDGNFTIPYGYECPTPDTQMYLVSTGGNAGEGTNDNLALMAALGSCSNLDASRFAVNEATTVAAVYALSVFTTDYLHIGSQNASPAGVAAAFATAKDLVDVTTGLPRSRTVSGIGVDPQAKVDTLADIIAACASTAGSVPGDGSVCDQFFTASNPKATPAERPINTLQATLALARSGTGVVDAAGLHRLAVSNTSFQPELAAQPADWTLPVSFSNAPPGALPEGRTVSVDSAGNVWIRSGGNGATEFVGAAPGAADLSTPIPRAAGTENQP